MSRMRGCFQSHAPYLAPFPFWNLALRRIPHAASLLFSTTCKRRHTHESYLNPVFSDASGLFSVDPGVGVPSTAHCPSSPFDPTPLRHLYSPILRSEVPCT